MDIPGNTQSSVRRTELWLRNRNALIDGIMPIIWLVAVEVLAHFKLKNIQFRSQNTVEIGWAASIPCFVCIRLFDFNSYFLLNLCIFYVYLCTFSCSSETANQSIANEYSQIINKTFFFFFRVPHQSNERIYCKIILYVLYYYYYHHHHHHRHHSTDECPHGRDPLRIWCNN